MPRESRPGRVATRELRRSRSVTMNYRLQRSPRIWTTLITWCRTLFHVHILVVELLGVRVHGVEVDTRGAFCERANGWDVMTGCPDVSTFDIVDMAAYAGVWYEIGSTAQFKLLSEAGLDCLRANYTLQDQSGLAASLAVVNSGVRSLGPVATLGVTSISAGAKEVCVSARDVCSYLGLASAMMQSVAELRKISDMVRRQVPEQALTLDGVARTVQGFGDKISTELTMVAEHVGSIQTSDGYLSAGNGTTAVNVQQIKLGLEAISKHVDVFVEFVHEMATARSLLGQVSNSLVLFSPNPRIFHVEA